MGKPTIENMHALAQGKGGRCLSKTYVNALTKLNWKCENGHQWWALHTSIQRGSWCRKCFGTEKNTIEDMHSMAHAKAGRCLSTVYVNAQTKLNWKCAKGHQWWAQPTSIQQGSWCPKCGGRQKNTIEDMHSMAHAKAGRCLSTVYVNAQTKLEWECQKGHRWFAVPMSVKQGNWCKRCATAHSAKKRAHSIEMMQQLAAQRGGKCLSAEYKNSRTHLDWECASGHQWRATPDGFNRGKWCPQCAGKQRKTLEDMKILASTNGGRCLSDTYINAKTNLLWQCRSGHKWWAVPSNVQHGNWCRKCAGLEKKTIEEMQYLAAQRGGTFLSDSYASSATRHLWQCREGHSWEATPSSIVQGSWCPHCAGLARKTIDDMVALARARGGKFISLKYRNQHTKTQWECAEGHRWIATPYSITNGSWCPECSRSRSERFVRLNFEQLFHENFPARKPKWLVNSRGNRMELDGYCPRLRLAFEYHGMQHFKPKAYYHRHAGALAQRKADDREKRNLCKTNGVKLIEISYLIPAEQIKESIVSECQRLGIGLPLMEANLHFNLEDVYVRRILARMQKCAAAQGGRCLSKAYIDSKTKLEWECVKGHRWWALPQSIQRGHWCPACVGKKKRNLQDMHALAHARGGKCLSTVYVNAHTKINWKCENGHQWWALHTSIQRGSWCRKCAGMEKKTIEEMQYLAVQRGGKCLSTEYKNGRTHLDWECASGHQWKTTPENIQRGTWCPQCAGKQRKTLEDMKILASANGGRCLSDTYINSETKLFWQCGVGHQWKAAPENIQQGSWCKRCATAHSAKKRANSIEMMEKLAEQQGGKCLSTEYKNRHTHLDWECASGHQWKAKPGNIQQGTWCPQCAGKQRKTLEDMKILASANGGRCLSDTYVNNRTKLFWQCRAGHKWWAVPPDIQQGQWCPQCAGNQRKTLEDMQILASANGGRCLSDTYVNNRTKLFWQCRAGHKWWAVPRNIQQGQWCGICRRRRKGSEAEMEKGYGRLFRTT